jgi:hypothetical protein
MNLTVTDVVPNPANNEAAFGEVEVKSDLLIATLVHEVNHGFSLCRKWFVGYSLRLEVTFDTHCYAASIRFHRP